MAPSAHITWGQGVVTGFADVWLAGGTHSNNTDAADLLTQTVLVTPLRTPRSASHGGDDHFWAMVVPIFVGGYRFHGRS